MEEVLIFLTGLLAILNPLAMLPLFQDSVESYPKLIRKKIVVRTSIAAGILMLVVTWFGASILTALQIEIGAMQTAGGIVMFRAAFGMLDPKDKKLKEDEMEQMDAKSWSAQAVVPLAIPLTVGGGTMAYIIAYSVGLSYFQLSIMSAVCLMVAIGVGLLYHYGQYILDKLGTTGTRIIVRISGVILLAMSIQIATGGIRQLLFT